MKEVRYNTEAIAQAAMQYAALGWHVLPLRGRSKVPRIGEWQHNASDDEEIIVGWWEAWPNSNVGVQLGPRSGIIDIECDSPRAEAEIVALFNGDVPVCPTYQAKRGKHRLFKYRGDLAGGACFHCGEIEIRTGNGDKGAQSVFPPSIHETGVIYKWLISPFDVDPPEIPEAVYVKLCNCGGESPIREERDAKSFDYYEKLLQGVGEGSRNESMASLIGHQLRNHSNLDDTTAIKVAFELARAANERHRPPMADKEIRTTFTSILKAEQNRRLSETAAEMLQLPPKQQIADKAELKGMRLVIVDSDPKVFELYSDQFADADGGKLILNKKQMRNAGLLSDEALEQANYPLVDFGKIWGGKDGLYIKLVFNAEHRDAPVDVKWPAVVASVLWSKIGAAPTLKDNCRPDLKGKACRLQDGAIVFGFGWLMDETKFSADKPSRPEFSKLLQEVGAEWFRPDRNTKLKMLSMDAQDKLRAKVQGEDMQASR